MEKQRVKNKPVDSSGFTIMEIVVATVIFAIVASSVLGLFNYVLKINRRSQALSQAAEGMNNFVEFLVKEIQNGKIDFYTDGGPGAASVYTSPVGTAPCGPPGTTGSSVNGASTYAGEENKLGIINTDNVQECFYLGDNNLANPTYAGNGVFSGTASNGNPVQTLLLQENGVNGVQILNPANFKIQYLMFLIRPLCDPYTSSCTAYGSSYPKIQPSVTIMIQFLVSLPTGEQVPIYYQTSVSSNKYDIPNQ